MLARQWIMASNTKNKAKGTVWGPLHSPSHPPPTPVLLLNRLQGGITLKSPLAQWRTLLDSSLQKEKDTSRKTHLDRGGENEQKGQGRDINCYYTILPKASPTLPLRESAILQKWGQPLLCK